MPITLLLFLSPSITLRYSGLFDDDAESILKTNRSGSPYRPSTSPSYRRKDRASQVRRHSAHLVEVAGTASCCRVCWRRRRWPGSGHVILEVGVVASLLGRNSSCRVVDKHHLKQIQALIIEVRAECLCVVPLPLGERSLEIGVGCDAGPQVFGRGSESTRTWLDTS